MLGVLSVVLLNRIMSDWFECACRFFQQQTEQLGNVLQSLGNHNTISDIGGTDDVLNVQQSQLAEAISPMHILLLLLAMLWAYTFLFSRNKVYSPVQQVIHKSDFSFILLACRE